MYLSSDNNSMSESDSVLKINKYADGCNKNVMVCMLCINNVYTRLESKGQGIRLNCYW